jgi:PadR family transcriptional regulator
MGKEAAFGLTYSPGVFHIFGNQIRSVAVLRTARENPYLPAMAAAHRYRDRIQILQGTLDMLILQTLQWAPRHGYALSKAIRTNSGEILKVDTGSLYPALHRLERKGWIAAEWKTSGQGPRLRIYRLTKAGRSQLIPQRWRWKRLTAAIAGILDPANARSAT